MAMIGVMRWLARVGRRSMSGEGWRVFGLAIDAGCNESIDHVARETLAQDIKDMPESAVLAALARLERSQGQISYVRDRATRLLQAAWSGEPVTAMPSEHAELFQREERLGRMPMGEAYRDLSELEPRLKSLQSMVTSWDASGGQQRPAGALEIVKSKGEIRRRAGGLIGPRSHQDDPVLKSNMALNIVYRCLYALQGDTVLGDLQTSYFSAPNTLSSGPGR